MENHERVIGGKRISLSQKMLYKFLNKIQYGKITLRDKGCTLVFRGSEGETSHSVTININDSRAYKAILYEGSIGAGKSYMDGYWDTDNLSTLIEIIIKNKRLFNKIESPIAKLITLIRYVAGVFFPNSISQSKSNILRHYDLGNEFFKLFLDPTMMYSCALYEPAYANLEQASKNKIATICQHLQLKSSDHILEIGTGWGGFAIYAAREFGCKVTTTTISDKQYKYVKNEIQRLGLQNQIQLLNIDYRQLTGQYDKLVSIEMIEAVGHKYFDTFFHQCNNLLKPDGLFFLQAIVVNDQAYDRAKNEIDFIKKYIFPGGCLPSVCAITQSIKKNTQMQMLMLNDIGSHYVRTLIDWHKRLLINKEAIMEQGLGDQFIRMWEFYFCYCIAGFNTKYISDIHAVWRKQS